MYDNSYEELIVPNSQCMRKCRANPNKFENLQEKGWQINQLNQLFEKKCNLAIDQ